MSATERMIAYHLLRLKDKNPDVRIKSIQELALLQATEALAALEELVRNDDEELQVRLAAQEAGKTLYLIHKAQEKNNNNPPGH